ncbi:MAG: hypothetical protein IH946_09725 [Bacteroidetes bacterium]|nr:hypothetical protein [Bacteroidota bacterium]
MPARSVAQSNCFLIIEHAEEIFRSGNYQSSIDTLLNALIDCKKYTRKDKETIYILLVRAYIELDDFSRSYFYLRKMLNNNPNFKLKTELVEQDFKRYYDKFIVRPMFTVGLRGALSIPNYKTTKTYEILSTVDYTAPYEATVEYQVGGFAELYPFKDIAICADVNYSIYNYNRDVRTTEGWSLDYVEELSYFEFPVYLKKYIPIPNMDFSPYLYGGIYYSRLANSWVDVSLNYNSFDALTGEVDDNTIASTSVNRNDERVQFTNGILFGAGINKRVKNFMFSIDARYSIGNTNVMSIKNKYRNNELVYNYYYVDNDITIDKFELGVSVYYIFKYRVKKKRDK